MNPREPTEQFGANDDVADVQLSIPAKKKTLISTVIVVLSPSALVSISVPPLTNPRNPTVRTLFPLKMSSSHPSVSPIGPKTKKKSLRSTPNSKPPNPITTQTPDKQPSELPRRLRNRNVALSLKEVRKIAQGSRDGPGPRHGESDQVSRSVRRHIASWPDDDSTSKPRPQKSGHAVDGGPTKLPANYGMLCDFFDSLDSSIRLLRLKGSISTFTNISPKIECLTDRRFSYRHLAQLKYMLPEAIEIKRVLMFDERTSCMKPDLHVTLNVDAIECDGRLKMESRNMHLRKIFRARLAEFHEAHPQGEEIPEEILPEPFNQLKKDPTHDIAETSTSSTTTETSACAHEGRGSNFSLPTESDAFDKKQRAVSSHFSQSFQRHFSQKVANTEAKTIYQEFPNTCPASESCPDRITSKEETSSCSPSLVKELTSDRKPSAFTSSQVVHPTACLLETPRKEIQQMDSRDGCSIKMTCVQSSPVKLASTPARLMSATPALHPTKRCYMSPDDDCIRSANKLTRRPLITKSLIFDTPTKNVQDDQDEIEDASADDDILNILPESLLQSIREKERLAKEEQDPAISQAKRRRQMIARLPQLFNMIHFFFQSKKESVITKEEFMHKIIASHSDIVDRNEVEEQLRLLLELVPEWIYQKWTSSGDLLICINKHQSSGTIRTRLEEAK